MIANILFALWFMLPAAVANMVPIISAKLPGLRHWQAPLDGHKTFHGQRLFGSHKTWRGLASGIVCATIVVWLQQLSLHTFNQIDALFMSNANYLQLPALLLGPLFALGALGGDAIESFFKRQHHVASGKAWVPFDQLDYIIGTIIITLPFAQLTPILYAWIIGLWFIIHLAASYIGWLSGFKKEPI